MASRIQNAKDFWSGILFSATGLFFIIFAQEHPMGSATRMGPAYFPTLLGSMLALLGLVIAIKGWLRRPEEGDGKIEPFQWRVLGLILGSVALFAVLLNTFGLIIALAVLIAVSSIADAQYRTREIIAMIAIINLLCWVVFVKIIGMTVPVWPAFF